MILTAMESITKHHEGLSLYSECLHKTYCVYKATDLTEKPVDIKEEVQAMDFFHGLDNAKCSAFLMAMLKR
jgi:hypothetical protein